MESTAGWENDRGVALLRLLADAVVALEDETDLDSFRLPYPADAQRALNHTVLACLRRGAEPPRSVPELLEWCGERPLASWPLDLPRDAAGPDDRLLDEESGLPTELVREWWAYRADSPARRHDREAMSWALHRCRQLSPEAYTAFRRLLVERPVLTHTEWFSVISDPLLMELRDFLGDLYQEPPPGSLRPGLGCAQCLRCGTLLTPVADTGWWCERDSCRTRGTEPPIGRIIEPERCAGLVQLDRPLRQFVARPGRAALELEAGLRRPGVTVEMWPPTLAYTMRVTFPDGRVWALDVKDWSHPALLARTAAPVRPEPAYDEAFWVVPDHRVTARADYLAVFHRNRPPAAGELTLLSESEVLRRAEPRPRPAASGDREESGVDA
ncbi:hypothetical protein GCM10010232_43430 [Streptomyces amakusaensis]|uniref:Fis family transcriptional regulator n=1 Tax=Streptomyces amakusaensis TaxID=67271 RepID=A0ABW0AVP5_9ACTN